MSGTVVLVVLLAAFCHALWNTIAKAGPRKFFNSVMIAGGSAVISLAALPFLTQPEAASWPYLAASVSLQIVYYSLVAAAYGAGDMSQAYPLMRGTAPLIVAIASGPLIGEALEPARWAGVGLICLGVLAIALNARRRAAPNTAGTVYALVNAGVIAGYTLVDGVGVRLSGAPAAYTMWNCVATAALFLGYVGLSQRAEFLAYVRPRWHLALVGGAGTLASYGLSLWAMTQAPVAVVAALRETSILFGAALSFLILKERIGWPRLAASGVILAGAATIRFF